MITLVKTVHLLALVLALGSGITRLILGPVAMKHAEIRPTVGPILNRFASLHYLGLILLWVTGLWLYAARYLGADLGWSFHAKLTSAIVLSGIALFVWGKSRSVKPLPPARGRVLGMISVGLAILTVYFATITFA